MVNQVQLSKVIKLGLFALLTLYMALSPPVASYFCEFLPDKCAAEEYSKPEGAAETWLKASSGARLHAWYFPGRGQYAVIMHHGQSGNIGLPAYLETAKVLTDAGASVLLYDYEGYGASEGSPSNKALHRDAEAAYNYLVLKQKVEPGNIIHCGISLGTGAASHIASTRLCAGVILLTPYMSLSRVGKTYLPFLKLYPDWTFPKPELGSRCLVEKKVPVLIVHGEKDPFIPLSESLELKKLRKGPTTLIKVSGPYHIGTLSGESSVKLCRDFFNGVAKLREGK